jgi:hypothetical protein
MEKRLLVCLLKLKKKKFLRHVYATLVSSGIILLARCRLNDDVMRSTLRRTMKCLTQNEASLST